MQEIEEKAKSDALKCKNDFIVWVKSTQDHLYIDEFNANSSQQLQQIFFAPFKRIAEEKVNKSKAEEEKEEKDESEDESEEKKVNKRIYIIPFPLCSFTFFSFSYFKNLLGGKEEYASLEN